MYGIEELKKATGYTDSQVRDRLGLLSPILGQDVHRGKRGKILVGDKILATLRRMAELEARGLSPKEAQGRILAELGNGHKDKETTFAQGRPTSSEVAVLRELVEELRRDRDHWRELALKLQSQVEELQRLALPAPRRRWWGWWRRSTSQA